MQPLHPPALLSPFDWPLVGNAWMTTAPLKGVTGQAKQSGVMATRMLPIRTERGVPDKPIKRDLNPLAGFQTAQESLNAHRHLGFV